MEPGDIAAKRQVARAAYDADQFAEARRHYRELVNAHPADTDALLRLAWSERRLGLHHAEISAYHQILRRDPDSVEALGGLAVALARITRLESVNAFYTHIREKQAFD